MSSCVQDSWNYLPKIGQDEIILVSGFFFNSPIFLSIWDQHVQCRAGNRGKIGILIFKNISHFICYTLFFLFFCFNILMSCGWVLCRFTVIFVCYYTAQNVFMDLDFNTTVHLSLIMLCSQTECVRGWEETLNTGRTALEWTRTHVRTHTHTLRGGDTHCTHVGVGGIPQKSSVCGRKSDEKRCSAISSRCASYHLLVPRNWHFPTSDLCNLPDTQKMSDLEFVGLVRRILTL